MEIILRVLRLEVSKYKPLTIKPLLLGGGWGVENPLVEVTLICKKENSEDFFVPITSKNSASV
jgi:hypothetical protein